MLSTVDFHSLLWRLKEETKGFKCRTFPLVLAVFRFIVYLWFQGKYDSLPNLATLKNFDPQFGVLPDTFCSKKMTARCSHSKKTETFICFEWHSVFCFKSLRYTHSLSLLSSLFLLYFKRKIREVKQSTKYGAMGRVWEFKVIPGSNLNRKVSRWPEANHCYFNLSPYFRQFGDSNNRPFKLLWWAFQRYYIWSALNIVNVKYYCYFFSENVSSKFLFHKVSVNHVISNMFIPPFF